MLLLDKIGYCECWGDEPLRDLLELLEFFNKQHKPLNQNMCDSNPKVSGLSYLVSGMCEELGWVEHGVSMRFGWLTEDGKKALVELRQIVKDLEGDTVYENIEQIPDVELTVCSHEKLVKKSEIVMTWCNCDEQCSSYDEIEEEYMECENCGQRIDTGDVV